MPRPDRRFTAALACSLALAGLLQAGAAQRHLDLARGLAAKGRAADAAEEYRVALRLDPGNTVTAAALAALERGDTPAAAAQAPVPAEARAKARELLAAGEADYRASRLAGAREAWQQALLLDPGSPAKARLAALEAERYQNDPSQPFDGPVADLYEAALTLARQGRDLEAAAKLEDALKLNPGQAQVLAALDRVRAAASDQRGQTEALALLRQAQSDSVEGRLAQACEGFRRALELRPGLVDAQRGLKAAESRARPLAEARAAEARAAAQRGDALAARRLWRETAALWPAAPGLEQGLAQAQAALDKGATERQEHLAFSQAMAKGREALSGGDAKAASRAFERALALDPGDTLAAASLARAKNTLADQAKADKMSAVTLLEEAARLEQNGAPEEALALVDKALRKDPASAEGLRLRSRLKDQLGRP